MRRGLGFAKATKVCSSFGPDGSRAQEPATSRVGRPNDVGNSSLFKAGPARGRLTSAGLSYFTIFEDRSHLWVQVKFKM